MSDATYSLEKVEIGGVYYDLKVKVDAKGLHILYGGEDKPLPEAMEEIHAGIESLKKAALHGPVIRDGNWWVWDPGKKDYVDTGVPATSEGGVSIATDEEVKEMLDEVFGPRE